MLFSRFNDPLIDPAANYPSLLHRVTLQGYFGEILGSRPVEHLGTHGHGDGTVPTIDLNYLSAPSLFSENQVQQMPSNGNVRQLMVKVSRRVRING